MQNLLAVSVEGVEAGSGSCGAIRFLLLVNTRTAMVVAATTTPTNSNDTLPPEVLGLAWVVVSVA
jgi:hypothetical protein